MTPLLMYLPLLIHRHARFTSANHNQQQNGTIQVTKLALEGISAFDVRASLLQEDKILGISSDDGEPAGTAGRPILSALQSASMINTCLVVSRIFGGTKLGTGGWYAGVGINCIITNSKLAGGLVRAYGKAAKQAIQDTVLIDFEPCATLKLRLAHSAEGQIRGLCRSYEVSIMDAQYDSDVILECRVKLVMLDRFVQEVESKYGMIISVLVV